MTRAALLLLAACGGAVEPAPAPETTAPPVETVAPEQPIHFTPAEDAAPHDAHYEAIPPDPGCFTDFSRCHDAALDADVRE